MSESLTSPEEVPATPAPLLTRMGKGAMAVGILGLGLVGSYLLESNGKKATIAPPHRTIPAVEWIAATMSDVPAVMESQGVVEAVTETRAASEVSGRVVYAAPSWVDGGVFQKGEELLRIDDADYKAALANAQATLAEARLALETEEARAAQAVRDWKKLASDAPENAFATRQPHLKSAAARVAALEAAVDQAQRNLDRCVIRAPYQGRIRKTLTNLGSWLTPGTPIGEFFATASWQVRLPLSVEDYTLLDLSKPLTIPLRAQAGDTTLEIEAQATATTGEIDRATRTVHLLAVIQPGPQASPLLGPGLYVTAALQGRMLQKVVSLPRRCLLPGDRAAFIGQDDKLSIRPVKVVRSGPDRIFISEGITAGQRILATPLAILTEGMTVAPIAGK